MQLLDFVYAQGANTTVTNPLPQITTMPQLFGMVLNIIMGVGLSLVLIMLAMGFVQYVMSKGDKAGVESAQKWVTYSVVGGIGLFLVFAIRSIVWSLLGVDSGFEAGLGSNLILTPSDAAEE